MNVWDCRHAQIKRSRVSVKKRLVESESVARISGTFPHVSSAGFPSPSYIQSQWQSSTARRSRWLFRSEGWVSGISALSALFIFVCLLFYITCRHHAILIAKCRVLEEKLSLRRSSFHKTVWSSLDNDYDKDVEQCHQLEVA